MPPSQPELIRHPVTTFCQFMANPMTSLSPIPFAEQLPGPEDVNKNGNCWLWDNEGCFWDWTYIRTRTKAEMYTYTHWLPANAIPLPDDV